MANVPYLTKTSAIKKFLEKIQETGEPAKVTMAHLKSIGFTSSNDQPLLPLFKFLGFLDSSGAPSDTYRKYRNRKEAPKVLGRAIRTAYSDLYATYPNGHKRDVEALANYFRESTGLGERAVSAIVNTFKTLTESADFEGVEEPEEEREIEPIPVTPTRRGTRTFVDGPSIAINVQLTLPITENEAVYEKLFAALKKNLLSPSEEER